MTEWLLAALAAVSVSLIYVVGLRLIDRYEPDPWRHLLAALAIGAVVVPVVVIGLRVLVGEDPTLPLPYASDRPQPWVRIAEQVTAGLALIGFVYVIRKEFDDALDGVVYGAAIGAGLGAAQTFLYLLAVLESGSSALLPSTIVSILVSGLNQAFYGATFGAFFGYAYWHLTGNRRWIVIALGLATAALLSALHDTLPYMLARLIDSPSAATGFATRFVAFSLNVLGLIALAVAVLHFIRHESAILRKHLGDEAERGTVARESVDEVRSFRARSARQWALLRSGRRDELRAVQRLYRAEGTLAFHLWHMTLGREGPEAEARADELRDETRQAVRAVNEMEGNRAADRN